MKIKKLKNCLMIGAGLCILGGVASSTALVSTSCGKKDNNDVKKISYHYKEDQPKELRVIDKRSTIVILTADGKASNDLKLEKRDANLNPKTAEYIDLTKLDEDGTWKIKFKDATTTLDDNFTIALEIIDPTNEQHRIDLNIEALAATDSFNYIPAEYLISERAYNESEGMTGGDENVLKAIDFDALEADPDYNIYDTLLIPSTFNSISGDLNISSHLGEGECFANIVNLNFVGYDQTPFSIGSSAFNGCANFTSVDASKRTITSIGSQAFYGCVYLDTVSLKTTVADGTISIGSDAFYGCENLQTFSIPDATAVNPQKFSIGSWAFDGCAKLTGFDAHESSITITSIDSYAFRGCASLTMDGLNSIASVPDTTKIINGTLGIAFKPTDNVSPFYTKGNLITGEFNLSGWSGFSIGSDAFLGCASLKKITFASTTASIGSRAFYGCASLTEITIPAGSLTSIGSWAFDGCGNLQRINLNLATWPEGFSIGSSAFRGCGNNVPIGDSCTIVGTYANQFLTLARDNGGLPERWTAST